MCHSLIMTALSRQVRENKPSVNKLAVACGIICTLSLLISILTWSLV